MSASPSEIPSSLADPVTPLDHLLGVIEAPITLVEFGDYECPDCLNAVPIVRAVRESLGERLCFVFRHFPRSSIHPHASAAAEAAEAAGDQGKFWQMHEALFAHQKEFADLDFTHLALTLGLEVYQFELSLTSQRHRRHIVSDYESGVRSGVHSTPTFFINGRRHSGPIDSPSLIAAAAKPL